MLTVPTSSLLTWALALDAGVSGVVAVLQLVAGDTVAGLTGVPGAVLLGTGLFYLVYAALVGGMARAARLPGWLVWLVILGNEAWGLACAGAAWSGVWPLTEVGVAYVAVQALAVMGFALLQWLGLRRVVQQQQGAREAHPLHTVQPCR